MRRERAVGGIAIAARVERGAYRRGKDAAPPHAVRRAHHKDPTRGTTVRSSHRVPRTAHGLRLTAHGVRRTAHGLRVGAGLSCTWNISGQYFPVSNSCPGSGETAIPFSTSVPTGRSG